MSKESVNELLMMIGDRDRSGSRAALARVLEMGLAEVYPDLERGVRNDTVADLRNGAMEVLVAFGDEAVPRLVHLLEDANEEVRNFCTVMLGEIGNPQAVDPLIRALEDPDTNVRHGAAEALGKIGDRRALPPLVKLLHEDFWLQYPAVVALGELRDVRAVPYLKKLLNDEMLAAPVNAALMKIGRIKE